VKVRDGTGCCTIANKVEENADLGVSYQEAEGRSKSKGKSKKKRIKN
jgi:hypothetical protein